MKKTNYCRAQNSNVCCATCLYCTDIFGRYDTQRRRLCYRFSPAYMVGADKVCDSWEQRTEDPEE
jgi:hypothetical protein